jgi:hypothetical protein
MISDAVMEKVGELDRIDYDMIQAIRSRISCDFDGWSSKRGKSFTSFTIHHIHSPPEDPDDWSLKSTLLEFKYSQGRHTAEAYGKEIVGVVTKFNFATKVRMVICWLVLY